MAAGMALTRRSLVGGLSLASAGVLAWPLAAPAQNKLETDKVRIVQDPSTCLAPQYVAEAMLRDEGFKNIEYIAVANDADDQATIAQGKADFAADFALKYVAAIDAGLPITVLAGLHVGCFELFAHQSIRNIRDLKGKRIGGETLGASAPAFLVSLGAAIGFDAVRDVHWVTEGTPPPLEQFIKGDLDAFLAHPPEVQRLRARGVGHVVVSSTTDRPWSQYYCCVIGANNDYISKYPVATTAMIRSLLRAADICSSDPARGGRGIVKHRGSEDYAAALATLRDIPYGKWRDFSAEDTMRFYALRLHEAGLIKSTPAKIIAEGTDWRFLNEVKQELKI
jgi:NitT/TauT family transport system substrate-binding protein